MVRNCDLLIGLARRSLMWASAWVDDRNLAMILGCGLTTYRKGYGLQLADELVFPFVGIELRGIL